MHAFKYIIQAKLRVVCCGQILLWCKILKPVTLFLFLFVSFYGNVSETKENKN